MRRMLRLCLCLWHRLVLLHATQGSKRAWNERYLLSKCQYDTQRHKPHNKLTWFYTWAEKQDGGATIDYYFMKYIQFRNQTIYLPELFHLKWYRAACHASHCWIWIARGFIIFLESNGSNYWFRFIIFINNPTHYQHWNISFQFDSP